MTKLNTTNKMGLFSSTIIHLLLQIVGAFCIILIALTAIFALSHFPTMVSLGITGVCLLSLLIYRAYESAKEEHDANLLKGNWNNASYESLNRSMSESDKKRAYIITAIRTFDEIENSEMYESEELYNHCQMERLHYLSYIMELLTDIKKDRQSKRLPADRIVNALISKYEYTEMPKWIKPGEDV